MIYTKGTKSFEHGAKVKITKGVFRDRVGTVVGDIPRFFLIQLSDAQPNDSPVEKQGASIELLGQE